MSIIPGKYRHFKGGIYEVLFVAKDSETLQDLVVYKALYASSEFGTGAIWVRPLKEFDEYVNLDEVTVRRFEKI